MMPRSCGASPLAADECTCVSVLYHWSAPATGATVSAHATAVMTVTRHDRSRRLGRGPGQALCEGVTDLVRPPRAVRLSTVPAEGYKRQRVRRRLSFASGLKAPA